jgi:hypothetical protein
LASSTQARVELAGILLELGLQPLEQGEGVGGGAGEAGDHLAALPSRRTLRALPLTMVWPIETWPSPAMVTTLPPLRRTGWWCRASYKGLARSLRQAVALDPRARSAVPSTKGVLGGSL